MILWLERRRGSIPLLAAILLPAGLAAYPAGENSPLKIVVLEGEKSTNNIRTRSGSRVVVEVRDQNDRPMAGAEVVFRLPAAGPGGRFPGLQLTQRTVTNRQGQAGWTGFTPNQELGSFRVEVTAALGPRKGSIQILQTNSETSAPRKARGSGWWKILVPLAAGGVTAAVVAVTRSADGPAAAGVPPNVLSVTPGPVTIAGPR